MTELTRKLALRYRLEEEALDVQRKQYALEDSIPHCKYRLREAREKLLSYEAGGFRPFLDKLSGKWADVHDALQSQVRRDEAELHTASRELEQVKADYECRMAELEPLRALDDTGEGLGTPGAGTGAADEGAVPHRYSPAGAGSERSGSGGSQRVGKTQ